MIEIAKYSFDISYIPFQLFTNQSFFFHLQKYIRVYIRCSISKYMDRSKTWSSYLTSFGSTLKSSWSLHSSFYLTLSLFSHSPGLVTQVGSNLEIRSKSTVGERARGERDRMREKERSSILSILSYLPSCHGPATQLGNSHFCWWGA